jgi:hypothetical protein
MQKYIYYRTVFTFMDMMGMIGGLYEILQICGSFLVSKIANNIFMSSILNQLYLVNKNGFGGSSKIKANSKNKTKDLNM